MHQEQVSPGDRTCDEERRRLLKLAGISATTSWMAATAFGASTDQGTTRASHEITIDASPAPTKMDTARAAVLVVDMENDFGAKGGMFDRAGIDISGIRKAIAPTARVIAAARRASMPIVYLRMGYLPDLSDLGAPDSVNRMRHLHVMHVGDEIRAPGGRATRILIRDSWGCEIVPELAPAAGDTLLYKTRFSGFYRTDLDERLRRMGVKHLIVTGCTTSICVESTVRDAMFRDYLCVMLSDCMSEPIGGKLARTNHEASLLTMQTLFGWVSDSSRFLQALI